jgi:hypothetical protein
VNTTDILNSISLNRFHDQQANEQRLLSIGEILLQDSRIDPRDEGHVDLALFRGTLAYLQLLQTSLYPNYHNFPFKTRTWIAVAMARFCNSPDVVRAALGTIDSSKLDLEVIQLVPYSSDGPTLLTWVAKRFGQSVFEPTYKPSRKEIYGPLYRSAPYTLSATSIHIFDEEHYPFCGWKAFVGQLIRAGADLNRETLAGTALISVVEGAFSFGLNETPLTPRHSTLEMALKNPDRGRLALLAWLRILKNFDVDLEAYGRKESSILSRADAEWLGRKIRLYQKHVYQQRVYQNGVYQKQVVYSLTGLHLRLIGFEFGPNPEDWKFWFSDPTDQLVGEFWDMVEHPERRMPGAWDEFSW